MKNTRKNVIELLKAMELSAYKMKIYLTGDGKLNQARECEGRARGLYLARALLENEELYNDFYENYIERTK